MLTKHEKDRLLELIGKGASLRFICKTHHAFDYDEIKRELKENKQFAQDYKEAQEEYADKLVHQMIDIADDGNIAADQKKIQIETRKWVASKFKEQYRDKGSDNSSPKVNPVFAVLQSE